jgi:hypothetical protein
LAALLAALCSDLHHIATPKSNKVNGGNNSFHIPKLDVAGSIPVSRSTQVEEITEVTKSVRYCSGAEKGIEHPLAALWLQF